MASSSPPERDLECPVCSEVFSDPKVLRCTHLVCAPCLLTWLRNEGSGARCPLCRVVIFRKGLTDADAQVKALPTDLTVQSMVDYLKLLNSPDVCGLCDDKKMVASFYCLHCSLKLCGTCTRRHAKIPSLKSHLVVYLDTLTAQQLAEFSDKTSSKPGQSPKGIIKDEAKSGQSPKGIIKDEAKSAPPGSQSPKGIIKDEAKSVGPKVVAGLVVGTIAAIAAPIAVPAAAAAIGFTSTGIAAGSFAASLMSVTWKAGVGMGLVSLGQSVGAAGIGAAGTAAAGGLAGTAAYKITDVFTKKKTEKDQGDQDQTNTSQRK